MVCRRFLLAGSLVLAAGSLLVAAGPRETAWKQVDDAVKTGKPKTAVEHLKPIIRDAMNEKKFAEAIKAIAVKISLEGNIQGNKPEEKITRLQREIEQAPDEMKPAMEAILANWYWHYFQRNRRRFTNRTRTAKPPTDDFTNWDLPRILAEIDRHFVAALESTESLQLIPVGDYDDLLEKGSAPDSYRPTLFDVLAHEALTFYMSGEQAASRVYDAFDLSADSPIFGSTDDFLNWTPETTDDDSLTLKAIRLYQQLLAFHEDDADESAMLDCDLARLVFGNNQAVGDEKDERFQVALRRFADRNADHVISSRALYQLAEALHAENNWTEAHKIASEGLRRHGESAGASLCFNLIERIEHRSIRVATERVWNDPAPSIDVVYRNVTQVHFRLVKFDFEELIRSNRWQPNQLDQRQRQHLLDQRPVMSWSADLPETEDYHERIESLPSPTDVASGSYFLVASYNDAFNDKDNAISFTEIWKSDLAIVDRMHNGKGLIDGFVLNAISGEPLPGTNIQAWLRDRNNRLVEIGTRKTDRDGRFRFERADRGRIILLAKHDDQSLSSSHSLQVSRYAREPSTKQTLFFTDRAIYRPGQSVHFKGICISLRPHGDDYNTLPGQNVVVAFVDANGKEIEQLNLRSNDYGSFSGTVTAPRDRLMGQMSLRVVQGPRGTTNFSVEEYKRPKFQVKVEAPQEPAKLAGAVRIAGKATAYTGASINDAKVQWRVVREVQYPQWWYWRCWWLPPRGRDSQEIAHGTSTTDGSGEFEISFDAKPDPSASREGEPTFRFSIHADVTDLSGETRSASRVVNLGYAAISASLSADDWLTSREEVEIRVETKSLDGEPRSAKGSVKVLALKQPDSLHRPPLPHGIRTTTPGESPKTDSSNPNSWSLGDVVYQGDFETDASGLVAISVDLQVGTYRAQLVSQDAFGNEITAELPIKVIDPEAESLAIRIPELFAAPKESLEPGEEYLAIWGSGYKSARVFVEIEHRGRLLQSYWSEPGVTQTAIRQQVQESMRGGFHIRTTMVRENRAYTESRFVDVPWSNKELTIRWEHFVSKLEPAAKEVWTAIISGPDAEHAVAEMVATLYDASLDAYRVNQWPTMSGIFRIDRSQVRTNFENRTQSLQQIVVFPSPDQREISLTYRHFGAAIREHFGDMFFEGAEMKLMMMESSPKGGVRGMAMGGGGMGGMMGISARGARAATEMASTMNMGGAESQEDKGAAFAPDLSNVSRRTNLNETAFFFPHLISSEDGTVKLQFTMPEALTEWRFIGFAHDNQLRSGTLKGTTVTAKDLMVEPNPPRFLREGDTVEFTVKVSNQSPTHQHGSVRLTFSDARTGDSVDDQLATRTRDQGFDLGAGGSTSLSWRLSIPDGLGFLTYKAVGSTGRLSDGEEGMLPVLSRRVLVTESIPLPIRDKQTKQFQFSKLLDSDDSDTLQHQSVTLQMVSNPSWYAVMALPYLMEYPYQCSEQTFNRLYANALARHLAQSDPKIERVFAQWRATPALDSPLEKNQDLKEVMIEETPWVRQAESESQARRNVGILFDRNRLDNETARALRKLSEMQLDDGAWPWFPGGSGNDYITLYITTGFGRMRHLGVDVDMTAAIKSLSRLDGWMTDRYKQIKTSDRDRNHLSSTVALYLYGRTFFVDDQPIAAEHRDAWNYWIAQGKQYWLDVGNRQSQAHLAVALKRSGETGVAKQITESIKERSVSDEELGMYWRDLELSWWWFRAPIETQAMMIEMFDEVADDQQAVEDCKVWLLKQKQTQDWKTTKATADAVYALLLRGSDLLASDSLVEVTVGGNPVEAETVEAGTGFLEHRWAGAEVQPTFGAIELKKSDDGVAWGSIYWQYLEDMSKITPHDGTPLKLTKQLFVKKDSPKGPTLHAVDGPVAVGDQLVVRIVLRTDRDMEYVHIKDYRGSGTEPVNVLSNYKYQDGLAYYESTRDTASHFFIDYLPKGAYVFEYSTRVQLRGTYQTGIANIQCMYAPEFNSHSESLEITVE